jgi:hypothetical protein
MGAHRSRTRLIVGLCLAGLLLAAASSALASASKHHSALGSSCAHPLMTTAFGGTGARYYSVTFRPDTPTQGQDELDVSIHNPRVVICRAVVEERAGTYNPKALRTFHPTIGAHGGLSSPLPRPGEGSGAVLFAKVYARLEPAKISKPGHTSGCTLETTWFQGDTGDKQDFDVTLKVTGHSPGPFPTYVEVTVHNPKVEICSATITGIEVTAGGSVHKSWPVAIGPHGGVSSRVSLPGTISAPGATVLGRRK